MIKKTQRGAAATLAGVLSAAFAGLFVLATAQRAEAFPKFSRKENKPCAFCHVNPSGGGKRNAAGMWYKDHNFFVRGVHAGEGSGPLRRRRATCPGGDPDAHGDTIPHPDGEADSKTDAKARGKTETRCKKASEEARKGG